MIKFWIGKILCKIGIHKRLTIKNEREVNWIMMQHSLVRCKRCNKIF